MTSLEVDRNGLEVLDRDECMRLLCTRSVGRVGLTLRALPTILPVNYWSDGARIYVRTSEGAKLDAAMRGAVVAFEVDDFDTMTHAGWSVVVTGTAELVDDRAVEHAPIPRWAPSRHANTIAISTELVSGRRLGEMPPPQRWRT